jgi:hypothetical protein
LSRWISHHRINNFFSFTSLLLKTSLIMRNNFFLTRCVLKKFIFCIFLIYSVSSCKWLNISHMSKVLNLNLLFYFGIKRHLIDLCFVCISLLLYLISSCLHSCIIYMSIDCTHLLICIKHHFITYFRCFRQFMYQWRYNAIFVV